MSLPEPEAYAYRLPSGRVQVFTSRRLDYEMTDDHVRLDADVTKVFSNRRRLIAAVDGWYVYEKLPYIRTGQTA